MFVQKLYVVKLIFSLQILCILFGIKDVNGAESQSVESLVNSLVRGSKTPTVVYLNTNNKPPLHSHVHASQHKDHVDYHSHLHNGVDEENLKKHSAISTYWLDYLLRSSSDLRNNQPVDNQVAKGLRDALRSQCKIVDNCVSKCVTGQVKCKITCKIVFDDGGKCRLPTTTTPAPSNECDVSNNSCNRK